MDSGPETGPSPAGMVFSRQAWAVLS